ncbi:MAG: TerC family protein [Thermoanaerobaculum sp.]|nr:TerC family protein [Thermoanaerobaculum sp.]MDW7968169.1 TerC family protein [Thermoanaerobaculum sp.]
MHVWWWVVFAGLVLGALALDLLVFHRHAHRESMREAVTWSVVWVGLGLFFALFVAAVEGQESALAYLTAFLIEKSLSVDNLFVFVGLFSYFGVLPENQHRVLFWGILGAIVIRGLFIFLGISLLTHFHWVNYLLGAILMATGAKMATGGEEVHPEKNLLVRWAARVLPFTKEFRGQAFAVRSPQGWRFTPLFLALVAVEATDVMFAVDSIPAVLAISSDPFVVYTSNIFAILGLRALYFVLVGALRSLRYLRPALAIILVLVGIKMMVADYYHVENWVSLTVVGALLLGATVLSLEANRRERRRPRPKATS